jgi:hypothetical protein
MHHSAKSDSAFTPHNLQLYNLIFNYLRPRVESSDDLGTLISYSIIRGLIEYKMPRDLPKTRKWRVIKRVEKDLKLSELAAIYSGLQQTIAEVKEKGTYQSLSDLVEDTNLKIDVILNGNQQTQHRSVLLKNVLGNLDSKKGNYEEKLRIRGLSLMDALKTRGNIPGRSDFIKDYETLETKFLLGTPSYSWIR